MMLLSRPLLLLATTRPQSGKAAWLRADGVGNGVDNGLSAVRKPTVLQRQLLRPQPSPTPSVQLDGPEISPYHPLPHSVPLSFSLLPPLLTHAHTCARTHTHTHAQRPSPFRIKQDTLPLLFGQ
uniref:Uncharacterized protein n=1 Tax=Rousettus aegyptiacus TaxID=9407 RepID=A0A7J8BEE3_ROUAE|nr:hypothetical protein HJG63_009724 [Rousettus aegyptiacus]